MPSCPDMFYAVCPNFTEAGFWSALANSKCTAAQIKTDKRAVYLERYLRDIGATTLVVECDYTDGDYLDDFAAYYVKCFSHYECLSVAAKLGAIFAGFGGQMARA